MGTGTFKNSQDANVMINRFRDGMEKDEIKKEPLLRQYLADLIILKTVHQFNSISQKMRCAASLSIEIKKECNCSGLAEAMDQKLWHKWETAILRLVRRDEDEGTEQRNSFLLRIGHIIPDLIRTARTSHFGFENSKENLDLNSLFAEFFR